MTLLESITNLREVIVVTICLIITHIRCEVAVNVGIAEVRRETQTENETSKQGWGNCHDAFCDLWLVSWLISLALIGWKKDNSHTSKYAQPSSSWSTKIFNKGALQFQVLVERTFTSFHQQLHLFFKFPKIYFLNLFLSLCNFLSWNMCKSRIHQNPTNKHV